MAKRFFNQKVPNTKKTIIQIVVIVVCIIGVIICFLVANHFNNKAPEDAVIEMRESVSVEVNTGLPDKLLFFTELQNTDADEISIDMDDVDVTKVGEYSVKVKIYNKEYESKIIVVDTKAPELTVKDFTTTDTYDAKDFVNTCSDNSKEDCIIEFYTLSVDQNGEPIDYSKYSSPGTYDIQIVAKDSSDNITMETAKLVITQDGNAPVEQEPIYCKYGNGLYDSDNNILAVDVTESGCALDLNLYNNETVLASVNALANSETEKLKREFKELNISNDISLFYDKVAILNTAGTGIVGYSLKVELSIVNTSGTELVESYYLRSDGTRVYSVNKYNLN